MKDMTKLMAAFNTTSASWFELLLARLFGVKRVSRDSECVVTMHYWRGKYYMTDYKLIQ